MKSRLLSSATALVLLLGLVSTNLFAQITDPASVEFQIKAPNTIWRLTTGATPEDTVGRPVDWLVTWESAAQASGVTEYTMTLPGGTVTDDALITDGGVTIKYVQAGQTGVITNIIPAGNITVLTGNPLGAGYDPAARPRIRVVANRDIVNYTRFYLMITDGLYNGKTRAGANTKDYDALGDQQPNMIIEFENSDQAGTTYLDSTNFYLSNDRADGVAYNSDVKGFISGQAWPTVDSLIIVDRFGNYVPDFFNTLATDSLLISVNSSLGSFDVALVDQESHGQANLDTLGAGNVIRLLGTQAVAFQVGSFTLQDSSFATGNLFYSINDASGTADQQNDDNIVVPIYLSDSPSAGYPGPAPDYPNLLGVTFNRSGSVTDGDTVTFTVYVGTRGLDEGDDYETYLGEESDRTTLISKVSYASVAESEIGTIALSFSGEIDTEEGDVSALPDAYPNALALDAGVLTAAVTIKNIFGDPFALDEIGTDSDDLVYQFSYVDLTMDPDDTDSLAIIGYTVNSAMTTLMQGGGSVTSLYTRDASLLVLEDVISGNTIAGDDADTDVNGTLDLGAAVYLGTTSHPVWDAIELKVYAASTPDVYDKVVINVEPGPPLFWDLDDFAANLATANAEGHIVKGEQIAIELPMFALDTTYNRVSNLDLAYDGGFLDNVTINTSGTVVGPPAVTEVPAINILIDDRDPVSTGTAALADSIKIDSLSTVGLDRTVDGMLLGVAAQTDSSFIYDIDKARTDSSRINLGGVGDDPLGLRLLYQGVNYKLTIVWRAGTGPGGLYTADTADRMVDLGLFTIAGPDIIDSVRSIAMVSDADTASATYDLVMSFVLPQDPANTLGPNLAEKNITMSFDLPDGDGGIPAGIAKESVKVSTDDVNYYASTAVTQVNNSITLTTPIELNAVLADKDVYVKILDFVNPSLPDTFFAVQVITDATPISATNLEGLVVAEGAVLPEATSFVFVSAPDSITPDSGNAQAIVVEMADIDLLAKAYLVVLESTLSLDEATNLFVESDPVRVVVDSVIYSDPFPETDEWTTSIAKKALATKIQLHVIAVDEANGDSALSDTKSYIIGPKRGKRNMSTDPTNIADIMRTVYLVAGVVATPKVVDWFGLDLDQSGAFDGPDLAGVLAIWRGTGTLLASASGEPASEAKVELSYEAIDKANANLMINLENNGILNMGVFRIKYDTEKYVLGDASANGRLEDLTVVSYNNGAEGEYTVVVVNINGRSIVSGTGTILTIPVSAVGDKFDGIGEISLLNAELEQGVQVELNREALSLKVALPKAFALSQNYPNPFNPSTTVAFDIPEGKEVNVRLNVYNMRGQLIRTLVNEVKSEGSYQIQWDGTDNYGRRVSSGVYFYRITTGEFSQTRKMVILK